MQSSTRLGVSLGQLLSGGGAAQAKQAGMLDGMRQRQMQSSIDYQDAQREKTLAETGLKNRQLQLGSDDGLASTLLSSVGADSEDGRRDFAKFRAGQYTNPTQPLAFIDGGRELPAPSYVSHFPELQQNFAGLKQMLTLGDGNAEHLPTLIRGNQRNAITANLTPENASRQALAISALDGADPRNIAQADITQQLAAGGNLESLGQALLLAQGKGLYNSFNGGALNVLDGSQQLNDIGRSTARSNDALAFQRNTAGGLNQANTALSRAKTNSVVGQMQSNQAPDGGQYSTKPLPTQALKMQQDLLEDVGSTSGVNQDLSKYLSQIKNGTLQFSMLRNTESKLRNSSGHGDEISRNFDSFMSGLERLRNDSLRLNKGVQTDGDAQRAWNELITNINDTELVEKRLKEISGLNDRALKLKKARLANLRQNFNVAPLDFTEYEVPRVDQSTGASGSWDAPAGEVDFGSLK